MGRLLFACLLFCSVAVSAQDAKINDLDLDFYGFIRNEFFVDTYKGIDAGHEQFYLLPLYAGQDANGKDINEQTSSNLTAFASRMGVRVSGPEILGAKTSGNIEFDFGGILKSEPTLFRIRHAYTVFAWTKTKLTVGQTWHPFWGGTVAPTVGGLNTGAPFQCFSRTPQVRYDIAAGKFTFSGALASELQYTSRAIESGSYTTANQAKRNGVLPELIAMVEYKNKGLILGAGALYNRIKPRMTTTGTNGTYNADEFIGSNGFTAYMKYSKGDFSVISKGYYGQNQTNLTLLGGYGVATRDAATGKETYTCYTNYTTLVDLVYGKKWQAGLLLGYGGNLGTSDPLYNNSGKALTYGLLQNVQDMWRVSPSLSFNVSKLRLIAEFEVTNAGYGTGTFDFSDGLYADIHNTTNKRISLVMMYLF